MLILDSSSCMPDRSELTQPWRAFCVLVSIGLSWAEAEVEMCCRCWRRVDDRRYVNQSGARKGLHSSLHLIF